MELNVFEEIIGGVVARQVTLTADVIPPNDQSSIVVKPDPSVNAVSAERF